MQVLLPLPSPLKTRHVLIPLPTSSRCSSPTLAPSSRAPPSSRPSRRSRSTSAPTRAPRRAAPHATPLGARRQPTLFRPTDRSEHADPPRGSLSLSLSLSLCARPRSRRPAPPSLQPTVSTHPLAAHALRSPHTRAGAGWPRCAPPPSRRRAPSWRSCCARSRSRWRPTRRRPPSSALCAGWRRRRAATSAPTLCRSARPHGQRGSRLGGGAIDGTAGTAPLDPTTERPWPCTQPEAAHVAIIPPRLL